MIVKHALTHGYQKAWWSCWGIACGNTLYIAFAYIGHDYISAYPILVSYIEIGGVLFLLYLGFLLLFAPKQKLKNSLNVKSVIAIKLFMQGFFSALLNPKNILFYFSLLFTIIEPNTALHVKVFYALWMVIMLLAWDMVIALLFGNKKALGYVSYLGLVQKMIGIGFIAFSLTHLSSLL